MKRVNILCWSSSLVLLAGEPEDLGEGQQLYITGTVRPGVGDLHGPLSVTLIKLS